MGKQVCNILPDAACTDENSSNAETQTLAIFFFLFKQWEKNNKYSLGGILSSQQCN